MFVRNKSKKNILLNEFGVSGFRFQVWKRRLIMELCPIVPIIKTIVYIFIKLVRLKTNAKLYRLSIFTDLIIASKSNIKSRS